MKTRSDALLCQALEGDPGIEKIIGVDISPPRVATSKLEFREFDVRDAALHMVFVLDEIKDKARTYDININGSRKYSIPALTPASPGCSEARSPCR